MDWLRLILVDIHPAMCAAWERAFAGLPNVEIVCGRFEEVPEWDCIVAPGNSFGIMDGGLDKAIADYFTVRARRPPEAAIQRAIARIYGGELPIGAAVRTPTGDLGHPFLIYAPTMRVPMRIPAENVYLAMRATLIETVAHHVLCERPEHADVSRINTLLIPALGMGTGGVPYDEGARLMALAYEYALQPPERVTWPEAVARHERIMGGRDAVNRF